MHTPRPAADAHRPPLRSLSSQPLRPLASPSPHPRLSLAREPESPWAARGLTDLVPPATLAEARVRRDELATLLDRERAAAADFLLALSDFDRRRGWERLGHASLFSFLTRELGLSSGAAQLRLSAARLLPRHPAVEAALRSGRLCISAVAQLARVLTPANERDVLPRFLGLSAREAAEVAAALLPRADPPRRDLVTSLAPVRAEAPRVAPPEVPRLALALELPPAAAATEHRQVAPATPAPLHTYEVLVPSRVTPRTPSVDPLTADLRRLHVTVSRAFLDKVARARDGLSHAMPGATTEQVLEAALDLLLEKQARRKALVKRPRATSAPAPTASPLVPSAGPEARSRGAPTPPPPSAGAPPPPLRGRPHVPAEVERVVRLRDGDRCAYPLDAGGVCASTWQVELDHVVPLALAGPTTVANLRCACRAHNAYAAELELGPARMDSSRRPRG